jgi:purine-nucleoside phosphorylase
MVNPAAIHSFQTFLSQAGVAGTPFMHVVLGSGFGAALDDLAHERPEWVKKDELSFTRIPGLPASTVQDHAGKLLVYEHAKSKKAVVFQAGRIHGYEGHSPRLVILPVMLSRMVGVTRFLLTNAAGGIDPAHRAGDVMLIRDHVNMTGLNPLVGENPIGIDGQPLGPRFPDLSVAYEPLWREGLTELLARQGLKVHEGTYMGLLGPSFETPAEVQLYSRWGIQAVGMSTVWETIALKHAGARVGGLSLISNAACGLGDGQPLEHEKIVETCRGSARGIVKAVLSWIEQEMK